MTVDKDWIPAKFVKDENGNETILEWYKRTDFRFTEPFFIDTINRFAWELEKKTSDGHELLHYLKELDLPDPSGFIFHLSRCGSTLVSQMLSKDPQNLVLSEPWAAEQVLGLPHLSISKKIAMFVGAMRAYAASMKDPEKKLYVKLASEEWLPWLKTIYPNTPWIFIFRDPNDIIRSNLKDQPAWLQEIQDENEKRKAIFEKLNYQMETSLKYIHSAEMLVQYEDIDLNFPSKLMKAFKIQETPELSAAMIRTLFWYSKKTNVSWLAKKAEEEASETIQFEAPPHFSNLYKEFQRISKLHTDRIHINLDGLKYTASLIRTGKSIDNQELIDAGISSKDSLDCELMRKKILIDNFIHEFEGRRVLELGPNAGAFSSTLAEYASELTVIENNEKCIPFLKERLPSHVKILQEDIHHYLWKLKPGDYDVIVCAGVLYHSASPFYILEAMAYLKPKKILIDSLLAPDGSDVALSLMYPVNVNNYRYNAFPDSRMAILLGENMIDRAMRNLGYTEPLAISKSECELPVDKSSKYFDRWKVSYSKWWKSEN